MFYFVFKTPGFVFVWKFFKRNVKIWWYFRSLASVFFGAAALTIFSRYEVDGIVGFAESPLLRRFSFIGGVVRTRSFRLWSGGRRMRRRRRRRKRRRKKRRSRVEVRV